MPVLAALEQGGRVRTVPGSHAGFAVLDRLSLWQAQISLGMVKQGDQWKINNITQR